MDIGWFAPSWPWCWGRCSACLCCRGRACCTNSTGEASNTSQRHVYQVGDYDHIGEEGRGNGDVPRPTQGKAGLDLTMLIGLHLLTSNFLIASALNGSMLTSHLVKSSFQVLFLCCGCPPCVWEWQTLFHMVHLLQLFRLLVLWFWLHQFTNILLHRQVISWFLLLQLQLRWGSPIF